MNITTYGETVDVRSYIEQLQIHQYIPQADALIMRELHRLASEQPVSVLDVGMGPGRLTDPISKISGVACTGIDVSHSFVEYARKNLDSETELVCADFLKYKPGHDFDALVLQGVWHHVPTEERRTWFVQLEALTAPKGTIIVGDEFVAPHDTEEQRTINVVLFYAHIIAEAVKVDCEGLVFDETLNLLADALYAMRLERGFYDESLLNYVRKHAIVLNSQFEHGRHGTAREGAKKMLEQLRLRTCHLATTDANRIDRGDYKTSVAHLVTEFAQQGWKTRKQLLVGPVQTLGGMGVLAFERV